MTPMVTERDMDKGETMGAYQCAKCGYEVTTDKKKPRCPACILEHGEQKGRHVVLYRTNTATITHDLLGEASMETESAGTLEILGAAADAAKGTDQVEALALLINEAGSRLQVAVEAKKASLTALRNHVRQLQREIEKK